MKNFLLIVTIFVSGALIGVEKYTSPITGKQFDEEGKYTLEQIKARDERVLKKTGGFLVQKESGPQVLFVDSRENPTRSIEEVARLYKLGTRLSCQWEKMPRSVQRPLVFARNLMETKKPLLVIVIIEQSDELPALSVFPEERIGLVNADKLKGGLDSSAYELRIAKEIWRALGFVSGIGFSQMQNDVMQPLYTIAELDANNFPYIQPMNMAKMQVMWKRFGVSKERRIPYRIACQEGWANPPTNDYQKAVWEEVHAIPQDAMKIQFDPAAQKGTVTK